MKLLLLLLLLVVVVVVVVVVNFIEGLSWMNIRLCPCRINIPI